MFSPDNLNIIERCVAEHFAAPGYAYNAASVDDFIACLEAVRYALASQSGLTQRDVEVAVVAAIMGPYGAHLASSAGQQHLSDLLALADSLPIGPAVRLHELAIAYGVGRYREVIGGGWNGLWHGAVMALYAMVARATEAARTVSSVDAARVVDEDAEILLESLLRPYERVHQSGFQRPAVYAVTVLAKPDASDLRLELFDPTWPNDRELLPGTSVKSFHLEGDGTLELKTDTGSVFSVPAGGRVAVRADPAKPTVDIVPLEDPVQRLPLRSGSTVTLMVSRHDTLHAWRCLCGSSICRTWHRLEAWTPEQGEFTTFVRRAIGKSDPIRGIRSMAAAILL